MKLFKIILFSFFTFFIFNNSFNAEELWQELHKDYSYLYVEYGCSNNSEMSSSIYSTFGTHKCPVSQAPHDLKLVITSEFTGYSENPNELTKFVLKIKPNFNAAKNDYNTVAKNFQISNFDIQSASGKYVGGQIVFEFVGYFKDLEETHRVFFTVTDWYIIPSNPSEQLTWQITGVEFYVFPNDNSNQSATNDLKEVQQQQVAVSESILDNIVNMFKSIVNLPANIWNAMKSGFEAITGALGSLGDRISGFFTNLSNNISGFFDSLGDRISVFFDNLLDGILQGLKDLFIPSDDFFSTWFDEINTNMSAKLGVLYLPFEILDTFNSYIQQCSEGNYVIHIPSIKEPFNDFEIIKEQNFDIGEIFNTGAIGRIHDLLLIVVDVILVFGVINLSIKKFNEMFGGTSE